MNKKNIVPYVTIGMLLVYMLSVAASVLGLMVTGSSFTAAVIALELATALSTPAILLLFMVMPSGISSNMIAKKLSVIFMACCMLLTTMVHFIQLSITTPMIISGIQVPTYLQVGYWPSVSMAVDYLAWGFFMGSAFLSSSFSIELGKRVSKALKYTLLVCAILCYTGLLGVLFINENCWYIAPMGYGLGLLIVCLEIIHINKCSE